MSIDGVTIRVNGSRLGYCHLLEAAVPTEIVPLVTTLDSLKRIAQAGGEYWMARDILPHLGYSTWENFYAVIERAKMACENANVSVNNHFRDVTKMIEVGKGAMAERADCYLSRYACYLIAMNGDPRKVEIGIAQTYFAVQARRQEINDEEQRVGQRVENRGRVSEAVKALNSTAKRVGVQQYGVFHDAGYRGLYGMGLSAIKRRKKILEKEQLYDHAGRAELAANEFRLTQTDQKLIRDNVQGESGAIAIHKEVGAEVRATIKKIGGTMPEDLPAEPSLKRLAGKKTNMLLPKPK